MQPMTERAGEQSETLATAEAKTVTLSVPEMDCASCAGKVESSLTRVAGVHELVAQPTSGQVTVTYNDRQANVEALSAAVEGAGYRVTATSATGEDGGELVAQSMAIWTSVRAIKTWVGAVFLVAGLVLTFLVPGANLNILATDLLTITIADIGFIAATLVSGIPIVRNGYFSARQLQLDIDFLMGTAIVVATVLGLYIEAATLAVLFSIAELLERYAMDRSRNSLRELLELSPNEATVMRDGTEKTVPAEQVSVGETVIVRPGESIPVDGVVTDGTSAVDQSPVTGESVPVDKAAGDELYAGTLNETGYLEFEATSTASESTLSQIIELVRSAQEKQTKQEQFVDRFASYYTPIVVVLAILTVLVPPLAIDGTSSISLGGFSHTFVDDWETWLVRGLTLLVIACPCAFVISTPVSVASGITSAAKNGVLIKGGNHLEAMGNVDAIAFDKTGTLTKGELTVTEVIPVDETTEETVLQYASALEQRSEHPIASAILEYSTDAGITVPDVSEFETLTGKGVTATVEGTTYYAGKPALFAELGVPVGDGEIPGQTTADEVIADLQRDGKTVVLIGTGEKILGVVAVADEIRPGAKRTIERLHEQGVTPLVMLTGDNEGTARAVAAELGLDEYHAELLPQDKVAAVEALEDEYGSVAMVGDGINDAPALATASVSIAMGAAGTDTAIETADIALMGDDIEHLSYLYRLSNTANGVIRQNIWSSLGVKLLLTIGVPFGYVTVAIAVLVGDMGMSLGVTGNAMRLSRLRPE